MYIYVGICNVYEYVWLNFVHQNTYMELPKVPILYLLPVTVELKSWISTFIQKVL